jgi:(4S)-4-hydroxy-5-phosphonooxypentane-2,3-dione isomerase
MYVVTVQFTLTAEQVGSFFLPLMLENARASRATERGCRQFDVCCDPARPELIFLYEVYDSRKAFEEHLASVHFQSFNQATSAMITSKQVCVYDRLSP